MTAPKKRKERKSEVLWEPQSYHVHIHIAAALTSHAFIASKNYSAASGYRLLESRSLADVLLGLALACLTLKPKPFLHLEGSRVASLPLEAFPQPSTIP